MQKKQPKKDAKTLQKLKFYNDRIWIDKLFGSLFNFFRIKLLQSLSKQIFSKINNTT